MEGVVCAKLGVNNCVAAAVVVVFAIALFDTHLRANDALNIGDSMGIFS